MLKSANYRNNRMMPLEKLVFLIKQEIDSNYADKVLEIGCEKFITDYFETSAIAYRQPGSQALIQQILSRIRGYSRVTVAVRECKLKELLALLASLIDTAQTHSGDQDLRNRLLLDSASDAAAFESYLSQYPDDVEIRKHFAGILEKRGERQRAIQTYETIRQLGRVDDFIFSKLAALHRLEGALQPAKEAAQAAIAINPHNHYALSTLGEVFWREKDWKHAAECFWTALQLDPQNVYLVKRLAQTLRRDGKLTEAEQVIRDHLTDETRHAELHHLLGELLLESGNKEDAMDEITKATNQGPTSAFAFSRRIAHQIKEMAPDQARLYLARILKLPTHVGNPFLHALLGEQLLKSGEFALAAQEFRAALTIDDRSSYYRGKLAHALNRNRNFAESIAVLQVDQQQQHDHFGLIEMATAYEGLGQYEQAIRLLRDALYKTPSDQDLRRLYFRITKLKARTEKET